MPACTCQIILVLVFTYVSTTYVHQLVISRLPRYVYVSTYVPGWGTYYVPHMFVNWCKHVFCTWHQPAPKIRLCRYVCTRDTKDTRPRTGSGSDTRGNPYLHDRRANKSCTTRKRLQNHTFRNPSLKLLCVLFSYSLLCALLGGRWWRSSVFRSMILFWISSAIQQQTPQANTTATGTVAAGQQRPRAPTTPAGNTPSR